MAAFVWAFYYIQGEDGEDRSHPNAFKVPLVGGGAAADVTLGEIQRHLPLPAAARDFHFRFRLNAKTAGGGSTFFWLDVRSPAQKVPLVNGRVICKLLRLARPARKGLVFRRKPVLQWAGGDSAVQPLAQTKTQPATSEALPFHRSASAPGFDQSRPKYASDQQTAAQKQKQKQPPPSQQQQQQQQQPPRSTGGGSSSGSEAGSGGRKGGGSGPPSRTGSGSATAEPTAAPAESFEDFLSGGQSSSSASSAAASNSRRDVNLMNASAWGDERPPATSKKSANAFLDAMDPLAQASSAAGGSAGRGSASSAPSEQPKFDDDSGTVGPVTLAEMEKFSTSTADGSNVYNPNLVDKSTKAEHVRRAMEERERQVRADVEKARDELRQREEAARSMSAMKESAGAVLGPQLKAWAEDNGRTKNIRTLLSTMHQVMWEGSKWSEVNMGRLINPTDVKKNYRKAMIVVHPDKSSGRNAEQLLIAERVFAALNTAWDEFVKTNPS